MNPEQARIIVLQQAETVAALRRFERSMKRAFYVRLVQTAVLLVGTWRMA